ncbi:MAG: holo-ACP synthase [Chitinophagaceae bacterium]
MTIGIGCDIVDHNVTDKLKWATDAQMLERLFSKEEMSLYYSKKTINFLAGRFAAKEAVLKCIGTGMQDDLSLNDIQILQENSNKPFILLKGKVKSISEDMGINYWHLSITHCESYSVAFAVAEARNMAIQTH